MAFITLIIIAVGLSMDALAISIVSGSTYKQLHIKHALRIAFFFGSFQAFMPLIGYLAGQSLDKYISSYDHWVAFAILSAVGAKMIYESFKIKTAKSNFDPTNITMLFVLSLATSIDALAIGITLSILNISVVTAAAIIGLITFLISYIGVFIGKKFGHFFENKIEAVGGVVLIVLGIKILLQHLLA